MSLTYTILLVLFLLVAIFLVVLILVQQGKGAGMGASFGAGASNTLFGSAGSTNFLTKSTWFLTILFFVLSVVLGFLNTHKTNKPEGFSQIETSVEESKAQVDVKKENPTVEVSAPEKKVEQKTEVVENPKSEVATTENVKATEVKTEDKVATASEETKPVENNTQTENKDTAESK